MNKDKIPTNKVSITVDEETKEFEFFEYLTQEEEDEYTLLLNKFEGEHPGFLSKMSDKEEDSNKLASPEITEFFLKTRKLFIGFMIKNFSWDEYNYLSPDWRNAIWQKVSEAKNKKK